MGHAWQSVKPASQPAPRRSPNLLRFVRAMEASCQVVWPGGSTVGDVLEEGLASEVFKGKTCVCENPSVYLCTFRLLLNASLLGFNRSVVLCFLDCAL